MLLTFSNLGKFSEMNKQFHVKSWLTYQSYSSVWWKLSCVSIKSQTLLQKPFDPIVNPKDLAHSERMSKNKVSGNNNTFERYEDCVTVVLKWMDFSVAFIKSKILLEKPFDPIVNPKDLAHSERLSKNKVSSSAPKLPARLLLLMYTWIEFLLQILSGI